MKLKMILCVSILLVAAVSRSLSQDGDAILGIWQTEHGSAKIQIYKNGSSYDGKLVWVKDELLRSGEKGTGNAARKKSASGTEVLSNFSYAGDGVWEDGTVFDPRSGRSYKCKLYMNSSNRLELRAYMGISLIGKSQIWSRVN